MHGQWGMDRRRILVEIVARWEAMQPPPTLQDLSETLELDRGSVYMHVKTLRRQGLIHMKAMLPTPVGYSHIRTP